MSYLLLLKIIPVNEIWHYVYFFEPLYRENLQPPIYSLDPILYVSNLDPIAQP